jgi:hypothetical protein
MIGEDILKVCYLPGDFWQGEEEQLRWELEGSY